MECPSPKLIDSNEFDWGIYLHKCNENLDSNEVNLSIAPYEAFYQNSQPPENHFVLGKKVAFSLDPEHGRENKKKWYLGTIMEIENIWLCVGIDGVKDGERENFMYWTVVDDDVIAPCREIYEKNKFSRPPGFRKNFKKFLDNALKIGVDGIDPAAPDEWFSILSTKFRPEKNLLQKGMKFEAVDFCRISYRPYIQIVTVRDVIGNQIEVTIDGQNETMFESYDSRWFYPPGWARRVGAKILPPCDAVENFGLVTKTRGRPRKTISESPLRTKANESTLVNSSQKNTAQNQGNRLDTPSGSSTPKNVETKNSSQKSRKYLDLSFYSTFSRGKNPGRKTPDRAVRDGKFEWDAYLLTQNELNAAGADQYVLAPNEAFFQNSDTLPVNKFQVGKKVAISSCTTSGRQNKTNWYLGTVIGVESIWVCVEFDGVNFKEKHQHWVACNDDCLAPAREILFEGLFKKPPDFNKTFLRTFGNFSLFLDYQMEFSSGNDPAAPADWFDTLSLDYRPCTNLFKPGMKFEAVNMHDLTSCNHVYLHPVTVIEVVDTHVRVHFDGKFGPKAQIFQPYDSRCFFPPGYAAKIGATVLPPREKAPKLTIPKTPMVRYDVHFRKELQSLSENLKNQVKCLCIDMDTSGLIAIMCKKKVVDVNMDDTMVSEFEISQSTSTKNDSFLKNIQSSTSPAQKTLLPTRRSPSNESSPAIFLAPNARSTPISKSPNESGSGTVSREMSVALDAHMHTGIPSTPETIPRDLVREQGRRSESTTSASSDAKSIHSILSTNESVRRRNVFSSSNDRINTAIPSTSRKRPNLLSPDIIPGKTRQSSEDLPLHSGSSNIRRTTERLSSPEDIKPLISTTTTRKYTKEIDPIEKLTVTTPAEQYSNDNFILRNHKGSLQTIFKAEITNFIKRLEPKNRHWLIMDSLLASLEDKILKRMLVTQLEYPKRSSWVAEIFADPSELREDSMLNTIILASGYDLLIKDGIPKALEEVMWSSKKIAFRLEKDLINRREIGLEAEIPKIVLLTIPEVDGVLNFIIKLFNDNIRNFVQEHNEKHPEIRLFLVDWAHLSYGQKRVEERIKNLIEYISQNFNIELNFD